MSDLEPILSLWHELSSTGEDFVLATIVAVEGSNYRRPGARMLLAADGRRAGTVSGGCLEAEVARRAWWLTEHGPTVERYSTLDDDGDMPYGSGCGGVVFILLERRTTANASLMALDGAFAARRPLAVATMISGAHIGMRSIAPVGEAAEGAHDAPATSRSQAPWQVDLDRLAHSAFERSESGEDRIAIDGAPARVHVEYRAARPGLWIFGAGDDAKPLLKFACELGWFIVIADGRAHLATEARFPSAQRVISLGIADLPQDEPEGLDLRPTDAAVLMTHSFEQDSRILAMLLAKPAELRPAYIGVLGPQHRTRELLAKVDHLLGLAPSATLVEQWLDEINAPMGLDLGAEAPAPVALSILAEIHKSLTAASALPLRVVRASRLAAAG
ncbi:MAG TPA: XdhC family protein [Terracidiphilus sp.]|jgi:xanthine/CO dehydrogenase XdhC/CoxF family maturation factor|nr:XdhC family protein [Terracidiphilus sp.]